MQHFKPALLAASLIASGCFDWTVTHPVDSDRDGDGDGGWRPEGRRALAERTSEENQRCA